jgi:hypothetical protein
MSVNRKPTGTSLSRWTISRIETKLRLGYSFAAGRRT